jgi:hypothetical protein
MPSNSRRRARALRSLLALSTLAPLADAQACVSLAGSTACPAFNKASISTDTTLQGILCVSQIHRLYLNTDNHSPWLSDVKSTTDFDQQLNNYVKQDYVQLK